MSLRHLVDMGTPVIRAVRGDSLLRGSELLTTRVFYRSTRQETTQKLKKFLMSYWVLTLSTFLQYIHVNMPRKRKLWDI